MHLLAPDSQAEPDRWRVERWLVVQLAQVGAMAGVAPAIAEQLIGPARGVIALAHESGVFDAATQRRWRERLDAASIPGDRAAGPLPAAARAQLDALLAEIEAGGPVDDDDWSPAALEAFREAVGTLRALGALHAQDTLALEDGLAAAMGWPTTEASAAEEATKIEADFTLLQAVIGPPPVGDLRVGQLLRFAGSTAVDVVVAGRGGLGVDSPIGLSDDRGTSYTRLRGSVASGNGSVAGSARFGPAVPSDARLLRIHAGNDTVEVEL